ncbi:ABC transporter ATP-binding protein [Spirillospora sp. NPDC048819]|uniref:ABC transporter ATP-binding protein n=1 Tax=Spirillospora sp. NPDC048819 TaxID=3155268 RepID=UPI0034016A4C
MAAITIDRLHKRFTGQKQGAPPAVEELSLSIADGELFVLLGPSGCGKTTTLRCVAGIERQTGGDIRLDDETVNDLPPAERDVAMVFQFYALYPHLTCRDNIAFPLRAAKVTSAEIARRVQDVARMLRLSHLLDRRPHQLSGGEQQRVALGRAMVRRPRAFLMDEPLTNLDAEQREDMRAEIKHLQAQIGTSMLYVTHDQVEAMALGHRIAILNQGRLEQLGTPVEVYNRPATLFAARFIGSPPINLLDVTVTDGGLVSEGGLRLPAPDGPSNGDPLIAGLRPETLTLTAAGEDHTVDGRVLAREALGDETIYVVDTPAGPLRSRMPPTARHDVGDPVGLRHVGPPPPVYDPRTERVVEGKGAV